MNIKYFFILAGISIYAEAVLEEKLGARNVKEVIECIIKKQKFGKPLKGELVEADFDIIY